MVYYCFYSILALGISLLLYRVFLKGEKNFHFNRIYLLGTLFLCLIAPTLNFDYGTIYVPERSIETIPFIEFSQAEDLPKVQSVEQISQESFPLKDIPYFIYLTVVGFLLIRFLRNLLRMFRLIRNNKITSYGKLRIIAYGKKGNPFSFFRYIFINKDDFLNTSYTESVLIHEKAHSEQYHSADIILLELLSCFFWFNPFVWLHKKEVLENHEFQADLAVIRAGVDIKSYSGQLIKGNKFFIQPLMSGFSYLKTKNRLTMLHSNKSSMIVRSLKVVIALSIFAGVFVFSSFSPVKAPKPFVVMVDAGHGGLDTGPLNEKEINLQVALRLSELSKEEDIKIVLIRNTDISVDLTDRIRFVESQKPDLLLSLHSSVSPNPDLRGVRAFFAPDGAFPEESSAFSKILVSEQLGKITDKGEVNGASFLILRNSPVPAVLMELGYLSNSLDNRRLNDQQHQEYLATNIYAALQKIQATVE